MPSSRRDILQKGAAIATVVAAPQIAGAYEVPDLLYPFEALERMISRVQELEAALQEAIGFVDKYADVDDGDDGQPIANPAMALQQYGFTFQTTTSGISALMSPRLAAQPTFHRSSAV